MAMSAEPRVQSHWIGRNPTGFRKRHSCEQCEGFLTTIIVAEHGGSAHTGGVMPVVNSANCIANSALAHVCIVAPAKDSNSNRPGDVQV